MSHALLRRRWPWAAAGALVVAVYLASLSIRFEGGDPRPVGGAEDIARLSERRDLNLLFLLVERYFVHWSGK